jgi:hypothetical protein
VTFERTTGRKGQPLSPLHVIDQERVRKELDEEFGLNVLGLNESMFEQGVAFDLLRMNMARETSIRGSKA